MLAIAEEIEERRLHLLAGFPSMFEFCVNELGLSEGAAFRRILAARLGRRFPVVHSLLASGAVHLSTLELVREWLTEENHAELLEAVSRKTTREVQTLIAERFPRPDVPSRIRASARIEPLSKNGYKVEFTATAELCEKLELCRDLMSHANPSRDLAVVMDRAVNLLLADLQRRRFARTKRCPPSADRRVLSMNGGDAHAEEATPFRKSSCEQARNSEAPKAHSRRISNAARRQVFERDGMVCTYVSPSGRRCMARAFLELDHAHPHGVGGSNEPENLRVRCRAHNQLWAEQAYGREHVENRRHFRQRKYEAPRGASENTLQGHFRQRKYEAPRIGCENAAPSETVLSEEITPVPLATLEKLRLALRGLGFRERDARRAVETVARKHAKLPPVEQALHEAVLVASADAA